MVLVCGEFFLEREEGVYLASEVVFTSEEDSERRSHVSGADLYEEEVTLLQMQRQTPPRLKDIILLDLGQHLTECTGQVLELLGCLGEQALDL